MDDASKRAKAAILGRIRRSLGPSRHDAAAIQQAAAALLAAPESRQPKFAGQSNRQRFIARATSERLTATVDEVADMTGAVAAVDAYLARSNLPRRVALPPMPRLVGLDWGGIEVHHDIAPNEAASVGMADFGIAETGTLIFTSSPESPTLFNFLPLHHIILVEGANILRYMDDYWARVRAAGNIHPRNTNFITGTSGTADIEAKNVRGAHGPRFMHVVIVGTD
ncbi:MAG: LUD domain-containing protein [Hyphomicrobiaceae bacterium]|nr:LUD domain-containing protein [Hyphomicrobiaceae bacterium]